MIARTEAIGAGPYGQTKLYLRLRSVVKYKLPDGQKKRYSDYIRSVYRSGRLSVMIRGR